MTDILVVPQSDAGDFPQHRNDKLKILFEFYGKSKEDVFQDHHICNSPILNCRKYLLKLAYRGFKTYQKKKKKRQPQVSSLPILLQPNIYFVIIILM